MNVEVKEKWLTALRSGDYRQGDGELKIVDKFCCLGVLTDLYLNETEGRSWENFRGQCYLPDEVQDWADIDHCGTIDLDDHQNFENLASINDYLDPESSPRVQKYNFKAIADIIEKHL